MLTVTEVAEQFNRTTGRIRQICLEYKIGTCIANKVRLLKPNEVARIGKIIEETGRKKTLEKITA